MITTPIHSALKQILMRGRSQKLSECCNDRQPHRKIMTSSRMDSESLRKWREREETVKWLEGATWQMKKGEGGAQGMNESRIRKTWPHQSIPEKVLILLSWAINEFGILWVLFLELLLDTHFQKAWSWWVLNYFIWNVYMFRITLTKTCTQGFFFLNLSVPIKK